MIRLRVAPIVEAAGVFAQPRRDVTESVRPAAPVTSRTQAHPTTIAMIEEAFRTLRTNLLLRRDSEMRTFVITSARPGEGKSTVAANLACALAAFRKRVLLIDADLRRSSAHRFFGIDNSRGLNDVLRGTAKPEDVWQETRQGPMVLTSRPGREDPQILLESHHFARLMARVRDQFDFVLVDSAPVLAVADTMIVVPHVDAAVLVVRHGVVSESEAALTVDRLQAASGKVIGCVLSHVSDSEGIFHTYGRHYVQSS
jgi:capsular exopolysaccharide synthesis family protein